MEVLIPEIVLDEAINRYKEDLDGKVNSAIKAVNQLNRHLKIEHSNDLRIDSTAETEKYRQFLNAEIKSRGIKVLPYPQVEHKKIVAHDLMRKKPFKENGSGYRDYLIWHSVELQSSIEDEVVFITANLNDFGGGPAPHPDLPIRPQWGGKVQIIPSLNAFNEEHIVPHLTSREKLKEDLEKSRLGFFDIYSWIKDKLVDSIKFEDWIGPIVFGIPERTGSTMVSRLEEIKKISVENAFEIENGKVLVHCEIDLILRFSVSASADDFEYAEIRDYFGVEDGIPDSVTTWPRENLKLGINFLLNPDAKTLIDHEIASVKSDIDWIDFESGYGHLE